MEELPIGVLHTDVSGLEAPQEAFGNNMNLELVGVPSHGIIFSYAPPDMVRQVRDDRNAFCRQHVCRIQGLLLQINTVVY